MTRNGIQWKGVRVKRALTVALLAALALALCSAPATGQDQPPKLDPGRNVTVSTRNMDLAAFLELLSVSYKLNIVSPKDITGKVSVNFYDVPPLDALKAVLEANGYQHIVETTAGRSIIKIETIPKVEGAVPVTMQTFKLNYVTAADIAKVAEGVITKHGTVKIAPNANALIIQDLPEAIERIQEIVKLLDTPPRQVMIDAKIVELSQTDTEQTGLNWSMFQKMKVADITAQIGLNQQCNDGDRVTTTSCLVDLRAGILDENNATLILDFFDALTNSTIISRPSIRTLDNKPAHIISGQIVPVPLFDFAKDTGVRTLSGFQEEQVGVELTVTPHINEDGYITLDINPKVESIERYITVGGDEQRPVKNTRQANTTIRIKDGNTAVIGGLTSSSTTTTITGLPVLKNMPGIGWFFRNNVTAIVDSELIIFITAKTVKDEDGEPLNNAHRRVLKKVDQASLIK